MRVVLAGLVLAAWAGMAAAEGPAPETAEVGGAKVAFYPMDFLDETELAALRLVLTNKDALALFVPEKGGHAAMAVSPDEGFIRDGQVVKSATAIAGHDSAEAAATAALEACNAAAKAKAGCVVVLEVASK